MPVEASHPAVADAAPAAVRRAEALGVGAPGAEAPRAEAPEVAVPEVAVEQTGQAAAEQWQPAITLSAAARERISFFIAGVVMILAGGFVAAVNGATEFSHGSWLAAYLVLVGGVAQIALGGGSLAMPQAAPSSRLRDLQLVLWNVGMLGVAAGVISNVFGVVLGASIVVAAALVAFGAGTGPMRDPGRRRVLAYRLLLAILVISVLVGGTLAHTSPGG